MGQGAARSHRLRAPPPADAVARPTATEQQRQCVPKRSPAAIFARRGSPVMLMRQLVMVTGRPGGPSWCDHIAG
jgi:hypothetical protein